MRTCRKCDKTYSNISRNTFCECGGLMDDASIRLGNTRDSFGVGKEFYDHKSGKYIDNWKDWYKAGYRDYKEVNDWRNDGLHKLTKEKIKRKPKATKTPWLDYAEQALGGK